MKSQNLKLIQNKSYAFLTPLLNINNRSILDNIISVNIHDSSTINNRIYVLYKNYTLIDKLVETHNLFIKKIFYDDNIYLVSYKIPEEYLTDINFIKTSDYTLCSENYKKLILNYYSNNPSLDKIRQCFYPTEEDKNIIRQNLLLCKNFIIKELGNKFTLIDETFSISKFLKLK